LVVIHEAVLEISCGQKECAQTDRHTPMTTRPCGLRRAGNELQSDLRNGHSILHCFYCPLTTLNTVDDFNNNPIRQINGRHEGKTQQN